jgi:hypothetical protein
VCPEIELQWAEAEMTYAEAMLHEVLYEEARADHKLLSVAIDDALALARHPDEQRYRESVTYETPGD